MNRLIHTRLSLALAIAFGIGIAELSNLVARDIGITAAEPAALVASRPAPLLPATVDSDNCAIPLLPLVIVRPTDRDLLDARTSELISAASTSASTLSMPDFMPRVRLDMPYYSFGKLMPGATKD